MLSLTLVFCPLRVTVIVFAPDLRYLSILKLTSVPAAYTSDIVSVVPAFVILYVAVTLSPVSIPSLLTMLNV